MFCNTQPPQSEGNVLFSCLTKIYRKTRLYATGCGHCLDCVLLCHCMPSQACHVDVIIRKFRERYPDAYDRLTFTSTPSSAVLNYLAALREESPSNPGRRRCPAGRFWLGGCRLSLVGRNWIHPESTATANRSHRPVAGHRRRGNIRLIRLGLSSHLSTRSSSILTGHQNS